MKKDDLINALKDLASGINPLTNCELVESSIMKNYESIQLIVMLIQELDESPKQVKSLEEKSIKNHIEGKPDRHRFTWTENEKIELRDAFLQDLSPKTIAKAHQRTVVAVVKQLLSQGLIDQDEADSYL